MGEGDTLLNALVGAAVTVVFSFTGFSPLLGGAAAGYLQRGERRDGARVGAIAGFIAALPVLLLLTVFGLFGFLAGMGGRGMMGGGMMGMAVGGIAFVVVVGFLLLWVVGLSAVGGYLGVYIAEETDIGGASRETA